MPAVHTSVKPCTGMPVRAIFVTATSHAAGAAPYVTASVHCSRRSFLERMAAHAAEHGPVGGQAGSGSPLQAVPVYVAPVQHSQQQQQQQQAPVHELMGYVAVPMDAPAQQVYRTLQVGPASCVCAHASSTLCHAHAARTTAAAAAAVGARARGRRHPGAPAAAGGRAGCADGGRAAPPGPAPAAEGPAGQHAAVSVRVQAAAAPPRPAAAVQRGGPEPARV